METLTYWCWVSDNSFIICVNLHWWLYWNYKETKRDISTVKRQLKEVSNRERISVSIGGNRSEWGCEDWWRLNAFLMQEVTNICWFTNSIHAIISHNYFSCCFVFNMNWYAAHQHLGMSKEEKNPTWNKTIK